MAAMKSTLVGATTALDAFPALLRGWSDNDKDRAIRLLLRIRNASRDADVWRFCEQEIGDDTAFALRLRAALMAQGRTNAAASNDALLSEAARP